jgi:16S rRNA (uracil1498-N3)-methyltransferase
LNLYYQPSLSEGAIQLDSDESLHAIKVLRHKVGDDIPVTDGKGTFYLCRITSTSGKTCQLEIISQKKFNKPNHFIHIALSPTKNADRTEWFVEKATELGIQKFSFIHTEHSERNKINLDRITKVVISAMKQSGQVWMPEMEGMVSFHKILNTPADQKFIAYAGEKGSAPLQSKAEKNKSYLVLIGPEGDFSESEIAQATQADFQSISLGPNTLRTETAGVAVCHIMNLIQQ